MPESAAVSKPSPSVMGIRLGVLLELDMAHVTLMRTGGSQAARTEMSRPFSSLLVFGSLASEAFAEKAAANGQIIHAARQ